MSIKDKTLIEVANKLHYMDWNFIDEYLIDLADDESTKRDLKKIKMYYYRKEEANAGLI